MKPSQPETEEHALASKIAALLFTAGNDERGDRLVILQGAHDLGGWSETAAVARIAHMLKEARAANRPDPTRTPTQVREALEVLFVAVQLGETHADTLRVALSAALDAARLSERQANCAHKGKPLERIVGQATFHDCRPCGKNLRWEH